MTRRSLIERLLALPCVGLLGLAQPAEAKPAIARAAAKPLPKSEWVDGGKLALYLDEVVAGAARRGGQILRFNVSGEAYVALKHWVMDSRRYVPKECTLPNGWMAMAWNTPYGVASVAPDPALRGMDVAWTEEALCLRNGGGPTAFSFSGTEWDNRDGMSIPPGATK